MKQQIPNDSTAKKERFTTNDIDFIHWVFGKELVSQDDLYYILDNQHLRQPLLDSRYLFDAITSVDPVSQVSPYFYYYILVRQVMLESDGRNSEEYAEIHPTLKMIVVCEDLEDRRKVYIRAHLGIFGMVFEGYICWPEKFSTKN